MALTKITSTNIQPGAIESSSLETSGATAGTYGAAAKIPVLSVNAQGIVYAISEVDVAGVTGFAWDSGTEELTISTADGNSFTADISGMASETYVDTAISNLIGGAPAALDTLNELAAAINDDASYAASITTALGTKVDKIDITGATVGSASQVPVITFNAQGQITSATTTAVAGVSGTSFTNGTYTISTSDGGTYPTDFDARYFTETEAQANFLGINAKAADSDLLDGLNSTQFLRSDEDDTLNGKLNIVDGGANSFVINNTNNTASPHDIFTITSGSGGGFAVGVQDASQANPVWNLRTYSSESIAIGDAYTEYVRFDGVNNRVGIGITTPETPLHVYKNDDGQAVLMTLHAYSTDNNPGNGVYIDFKRTDDNATFTPQLRLGMEPRTWNNADSGIPSEGDGHFVVYCGDGTDALGGGNLTERFRVTEQGYVSALGIAIQYVRILSSATTNITVSATLVTIAASQQSVTARRANSSYLYDVTFSAESDITSSNNNGFFVLEYNINGGSWNRINEVLVVGGISDTAGGTSNNNAKWLIHTTSAPGDIINFRVLFQKSVDGSFYFNQQSLGSQPAGTTNYASGYIAEIGR